MYMELELTHMRKKKKFKLMLFFFSILFRPVGLLPPLTVPVITPT
jgi:hypothetical protein